ncbi:MAG: insulinase family protein, partial [Polyangiaceae bacterium]|nr:insulinase family protein [Polyangiaceae bacterium]
PLAPLDPVRFAFSPTETLSSGVLVRHVQVSTLPLVHFRLAIPVGFSNEDQPGLAALTGWALVEDAVGSGWSGFASADGLVDMQVQVFPTATVFSGAVLSRDIDRLVAGLREMITQPSFSTAGVKRARLIAARGLVSSQILADDTGMFGTPYLDVAEFERDLSKLEPWHCRAFHRSWYRSDGATVAFVGDVSVGQARLLAERMFAGWQTSMVKTSMVQTSNGQASMARSGGQQSGSRPTDSRRIDVDPDRLVTVMIAANGPPQDHPDWPALWLVAQRLGSECSPLPWSVGLAVFRVCKTMRVSQTEGWVSDIRRQLESMGARGMPSSVADADKRRIVDSEVRRLSDPSALADTITMWEPSLVSGFGILLDGVDSVKGVRAVVSRYLGSGSVRVVLVRPKSP